MMLKHLGFVGVVFLHLVDLRRQRRGSSFAPLGLVRFFTHSPRLAPWAAFLRRFAAGREWRGGGGAGGL
jgi:hypothetical protein